MPVSTFVLNAKHQVVLWNKAREQLTGLKAGEMITCAFFPEQIRQYAWPGNVRELQNVIERAVILSQGSLLDIAPLQPAQVRPEAATQVAGSTNT